MVAVVVITSASSYDAGIQAGEAESILFYRDDFSSAGFASYDVDFGDGSPHASGAATGAYYATVPHTYATAGTFTVTVVTDVGTATTTTYINPVSAKLLFYGGGDYEVDVEFSETIEGNSSGIENNFSIDWGDGTSVDEATVTATTASFSHTFTAVGDYTVTATNTNVNGTTTLTREYHVYAPTPEIWSVDPDVGSYGRVGELTIIQGDRLGLVTSVTFGGAAQTFDIVDDSHIHVVLNSLARSGDVVISPTGDYGTYEGFIIAFDGPWVAGGDSQSHELDTLSGRVSNLIRSKAHYIAPAIWDVSSGEGVFGLGFGASGWVTSGETALGVTQHDVVGLAWTNGRAVNQQLHLEVVNEPVSSWPYQLFHRYSWPGYATWGHFDIPLPTVDSSDPTILETVFEPPVLLGWRITTGVSWEATWDGSEPDQDPFAEVGKFSFGSWTRGYLGPPLFDPPPSAIPELRWSNATADADPNPGWSTFEPDSADVALMNPDDGDMNGWQYQIGSLTEVLEEYATAPWDEPVVIELPIATTDLNLDMAPISNDADATHSRYIPLPDFESYVTYTDDTPMGVVHGYSAAPFPQLTIELLYTPARHHFIYSVPVGMTATSPPLRQVGRPDASRHYPRTAHDGTRQVGQIP